MTSCDGYNVAFFGVVDSSVTFFYDPTSDNLVGVLSLSAGTGMINPVCAAGQPPATSPDCEDAAVLSTFSCSSIDASAAD